MSTGSGSPATEGAEIVARQRTWYIDINLSAREFVTDSSSFQETGIYTTVGLLKKTWLHFSFAKC